MVESFLIQQMVIPIDYHMVHRGHGVFDTSIIFDGYLFELDVHINRFFRSTSKARIASPFTFSELKSILIQLSAASKCRKGTLRYWLSAGLRTSYSPQLNARHLHSMLWLLMKISHNAKKGNGKDQALTELAKIISNTTYIVSSAQCTTNHITVDFVSSGNKTDDFLSSGNITAGSVNSGCISIDFLKSGCITFDFIASGRITTRTIQEACCWT